MRPFVAFLFVAAALVADQSSALVPTFMKSSNVAPKESLRNNPVPMKVFAASTVAAAAIFFTDVLPASALVDKGEAIFNANCADCHAAGKKLNSKAMSLKKEDLIQGPGLDQAPVEDYLKNKSPHKFMPFKLNPQGYTQVTSYVLDQAVNDKWTD